MTYRINFHCNDSGPIDSLDYYGQSMPLIPKVGEHVCAGLWETIGKKLVKGVTYGYSEDLITVTITVEDER